MLKLSTLLLSILESHILASRELFVSPFYEREKELGGYFNNEVAGWERALAYEINRQKLDNYLHELSQLEKMNGIERHVPYESCELRTFSHE